MAKNVKYVTNLQGLNELMTSAEIVGVLETAGRQVLNAVGDGYEMDTKNVGGGGQAWLAATRVSPVTAKAQKDNLENNTLLTALGSTGLRMTK